MPIKSFIAHPKTGRKSELVSALNDLQECEVIPSTNHDIVVVVTETHNKQSDIDLEEKMNAIDSLQMLSMVSGFDNKELNN